MLSDAMKHNVATAENKFGAKKKLTPEMLNI
jgi:hypothetical protein